MKANELMIGDYIQEYGYGQSNAAKVVAIPEDEGLIRLDTKLSGKATISLSLVKPIPLTEEILLSNDLVKDMRYGYLKKDNSFGVFHSYDGEEGFSIISGYNEKPYTIKLPRPIRYVHELQRILRCVGLWDLANTFKI